MKCPRTFNLEIIEGEEEKIVGANCLKEECAWWYARNQNCVVLSIADRLLDSALALEAIKEKAAPHIPAH